MSVGRFEVLEFMSRIKVIALEFNKLTDNQKRILKNWIRNTIEKTIADEAIEILDSDKEGVEKMVANNAFMIEEMNAKINPRHCKIYQVHVQNNLKNIVAFEKGFVDDAIRLLVKKFKVLPDDYKGV